MHSELCYSNYEEENQPQWHSIFLAELAIFWGKGAPETNHFHFTKFVGIFDTNYKKVWIHEELANDNIKILLL